MSKNFKAAVMLAAGLALGATPALALQAVVSKVDKNADGSATYHFTVKMDQGETMSGGDKASADFVTLFNFYGLVETSIKSPAGWEFSSEQFGRTPTANGYPLVLPTDVPNTPNLTWTATKPVPAGAVIDGFSATTRMTGMVEGQYVGQVTRQAQAIQGVPADAPGGSAMTSKQAMIGVLPMPYFLAPTK